MEQIAALTSRAFGGVARELVDESTRLLSSKAAEKLRVHGQLLLAHLAPLPGS